MRSLGNNPTEEELEDMIDVSILRIVMFFTTKVATKSP